ncbi:hypothetical protein KM043_016321 [Ampulex compressa]|nr:hypothetical protein KM043_016321 [Ampulex compressa]
MYAEIGVQVIEQRERDRRFSWAVQGGAAISLNCHRGYNNQTQGIISNRAMMAYDYPHPVSRTYQYKKITKPLLERKRRARINRCLDELKDLMVDALETEGENISKLEKADILELTVRHLQRLQASRPSGLSTTITSNEEVSAESRWQSGFGHCAAEACRFLSALPGEAAERLARHLAAGLQTNRQSNSSPKPNKLSPILADLDRTASLVTPRPISPSIEIGATTVCDRIPSKKIPSFTEIKLDKNCDVADGVSCVSDQCASTTVDNQEMLVKTSHTSKMKNSRERRTATKNNSNDTGMNDCEEEIDVEHVDEADPMWRPW